MTSPLLLILLFHSGMFSFWGTVALGPHVLLDDRVEAATVRRAFTSTLVALLMCSYMLALAARLIHASEAAQFLATVGPIVVTFLSMNGIYAWYFFCCRRPSASTQN
jgi:membrane glycosyltransferase